MRGFVTRGFDDVTFFVVPAVDVDALAPAVDFVEREDAVLADDAFFAAGAFVAAAWSAAPCSLASAAAFAAAAFVAAAFAAADLAAVVFAAVFFAAAV